jgi:amino acid transporter
MSGNVRTLRRELRTIETLALSIAMMSPVLAMSLYGGAPAMFVGRAAPLAFVLSGIVVGLVGAGLIYLCRYFSHAGSVYGLTGVTLGPRAGFFSGWALLGCYLIYTPASAATAGYFATLFCKDTGLWKGADYIPFTIVFLLVILVLATRDIKRVGQTLLSIEGLSLAVMIIVLVVVVANLVGGTKGHHLSAAVFTLPHGVSIHSLVLASIFGFTAFAGFEGAASLGEETQNPRRSVPKALIIAIVGAVTFYVLTVAIMAMGFGTSAKGGAALAGSSGPLFDLSRLYISNGMAEVLELGAMISAFSAALGSTLGGGRLIFAISRDARPSWRLATVGPSGAPTVALFVVVGLAACVNVAMRLAGNTGLDSAFYLGTIGTLSLLIAYGMVNVGAGRLMLRTAKSKAIVIVPVAGFLILAYTMYNELYPRPLYPYDIFPYIVIAWLVIGLALVALTPGVAAQIGRSLSETEVKQTSQDERDVPATEVAANDA